MLWLAAWLACSPDVPSEAPAPLRLADDAQGGDLAARDGRLVASWAEPTADGDGLVVAEVTDGRPGPVVRPAPGVDVVVGLARKPSLALSADGAVRVTWSTGDPRGSTVGWLDDALAPDAAPVVLATAGPGQVPDLLDQPEAFEGPDGPWVLYKGQVDHPTMGLFLARASTGWAPERLDPFPGRPCECCPHRLDATPGGDVLLTVRNDERNLREIWLARADAGTTAFDRRSQVSTTGWVVQGCPFDGPRTAVVDDDRLIVAWTDAASGRSRLWVATSDDGGASWSGEAAPFPDDGTTAWGFPAVAATSARTWVAAEVLGGTVRVAVDGGDGFVEVAPEVAVEAVELVADADGAWLLGHAPDGALWLQRLSAPR